MGLKFLQKKKWHPLTIENLEIVWLAEQKHKENRQLLKEHNKRIEEERKDEELKRAQVKAGLIPESDLQKMTWMYDVPNVAQQKGKNIYSNLFLETSNNMEDFFNAEANEEEEDEQKRILRQAQEQKERMLWWILNNPRDVKIMVKEFRKNKSDSSLNPEFLQIIEKVLDKKKNNKKKKEK